MSQENNLRVTIRITPNFLDQITDDIRKLQSIIPTLPGNLEVTFESSSELRAKDTPTTFFGRERENGLPAVCEFPDRHFDEPENLRMIILLHELIHAHQRQTILRNWDTITMNKSREYDTLGKVGIEMSLQMGTIESREILLERHFGMIKLIHEFYKIIFEAWDHLEMQNNFPQFFEVELINVHGRISNGTQNGTFDNWGEGHMFHMFAKLLEATFFAKITNDLQISLEYLRLAGFWRMQLRKVCIVEQFQVLLNVVDSMTNPSRFPDSAILEQQYDAFCELLVYGKVFET